MKKGRREKMKEEEIKGRRRSDHLNKRNNKNRTFYDEEIKKTGETGTSKSKMKTEKKEKKL